MVTYLSTQYPNKNIGHHYKSEAKDNNTTCTAAAGKQVGEVITPEDSTAPSNGSSIGTHISEVAKHKSWPAQSAEDLLGAHPINDAIWGCTDPSNVSIDTTNSAEIMAGSHIRKEQT